ncbi:MAG: hypothetical protein ACKVUT_01880 [Gaiella sp.]
MRRVARRVEPGMPGSFVVYQDTWWVNRRLPGVRGKNRSFYARPPVRVAVASVTEAVVAVERADGPIDIRYWPFTGRGNRLIQTLDDPGEVVAIRGWGGEFVVLDEAGMLNWYRRRIVTPPAPPYELAARFKLSEGASFGDDGCYRERCALAEVRLADLDRAHLVYIRRNAIHMLNLRTGKDIVVRRPSRSPVHAQLEPAGMIYSHGDRISLVGRKKLDALFR